MTQALKLPWCCGCFYRPSKRGRGPRTRSPLPPGNWYNVRALYRARRKKSKNPAAAPPPPPPPPSTWHGLKPVYNAVHGVCRTTKQLIVAHKNDPKAFPFFKLPRELRDKIYGYLISASAPSTHLTSAATMEDVRFRGPMLKCQPCTPHNTPHAAPTSDPVALQPDRSTGFIAIYSPPTAPKALLLVCRQMRAEIMQRYSIWNSVFEVAPLTPHVDEWSFDPLYEALLSSSRLSRVRKLRVRVDLARLRIRPTPSNYMPPYRYFVNLEAERGPVRFEEIGVLECVQRVRAAAENLVRVLREGAGALNVLVLDWKDDFDADEEVDWELKRSVLKPFGRLDDVRVMIGNVVVRESGREKARKMLGEALESLGRSEGV
ncbi:hypothetical protein K505DRAFT_323136 [Melanomma pulvis-pyrius CBS 109.77]|uniref:F-box domain-containing protein n=1 Tax=Melanomma pulvis-pyrius CBS 109.77 TaxID=1314802 RepID=A0A6A6XM33_9PLEO|nr:hypothetical protein K505DRAFT_323136 [Melanomma pulvis-pyrius CBS 109.77]